MKGATQSFTATGGTPGSLSWEIRASDGGVFAAAAGSTTGVVTFDAIDTFQVKFTSLNSTVPTGCLTPATRTAQVSQLVTQPACSALTPMSISPAAPPAIAAGQSASFVFDGGVPTGGVATNPDWTVGPLDGGPFIATGTGRATGNVLFPNAGTYAVKFTVTNNATPAQCAPPVVGSLSVTQVVSSGPCNSPLALVVPSLPVAPLTAGLPRTFIVDGGTPGTLTWNVTRSDGGTLASGTGPRAGPVLFDTQDNYSVSFSSTNTSPPALCTGSPTSTLQVGQVVNGEDCSLIGGLRDDFRGGVLNSAVWSASGTAPGAIVAVNAGLGVANVGNRGYLRTVASFDPRRAPVRVTGEYTITGDAEDYLQVLTRTSGQAMVPAPYAATYGLECLYDLKNAAFFVFEHSAMGSLNVTSAATVTGTIGVVNAGQPVQFEVFDDGVNFLCSMRKKGSSSVATARIVSLVAPPGASPSLVAFTTRERTVPFGVPLDHTGNYDNLSIEQGVGLRPGSQWTFDDIASTTIYPSAGSVSGTMEGGATTQSAGLLGPSLQLDGAFSSAANFGTAVGSVGTAPFTVSFWFKTANTSRGVYELVGNRSSGSASTSIGTRLVRGPAVLGGFDSFSSLEVYDLSTPTASLVPQTLNTNLLNGAWHHLAVTRQGTTGAIYLDGVLHQTMTAPLPANIVTSAPFLAGRISGFSGGEFIGEFDDIRLYPVALSTCAVRASEAGFLPAPTAAPVPTVSYAPKTVRLTWPTIPGASWYRVTEDPTGTGPARTVGDFPSATADVAVSVHLLDWTKVRYQVFACNSSGCGPGSAPVAATGAALSAIGYLKASNTGAQDRLGRAVAVSGDGQTLAVGAIFEASGSTTNQSDNSGVYNGAVYVFVKSPTGWVQQAYVKPADPVGDKEFGASLSLSTDGNTLAVGAPVRANGAATSAGAAYVFTRTGATWAQQGTPLLKSSPGVNDVFGFAVSLSGSGDSLAVGGSGYGAGDAGVVVIYRRLSSMWMQEVEFFGSTANGGERLGRSVALSRDGQWLAVGAPFESSATGGINVTRNGVLSNAGAVYVYQRLSPGGWLLNASIKPTAPGLNDNFGSAVGFDEVGSVLAVGAINQSSVATNSGAVYFFTRTSSWSAAPGFLKAPTAHANDQFGWALAFSADGKTLVVTAPFEDGNAVGVGGVNGPPANDSGAAYTFSMGGLGWPQATVLSFVKATNTGAGDLFGFDVALSADGTTLLVGAREEDGSGIGVNPPTDNLVLEAGAAYLY